MHIGVKQDHAIQTLSQKVEELEKNIEDLALLLMKK